MRAAALRRRRGRCRRRRSRRSRARGPIRGYGARARCRRESPSCVSAYPPSSSDQRTQKIARAMPTAWLHLPDAAATEAAGVRLASTLSRGMIVTLSGELGTGKTTLVRGCLRALGWQGRVKSPTYTLVEHYPFSSIYFYHF